MTTWTSIIIGLAFVSADPVDLSADSGNVVSIQQVSAECGSTVTCAAPTDAVCCVSNGCTSDAGCCNSEGCCGSEFDCCDGNCCGVFCNKCCGCGCWSDVFKYSTCNLYPHYAYYPECHGRYYFRPYTWVHIAQDRIAFPGIDQAMPYSNAIFDDIEKAAAEKYGPSPEANSDQTTSVVDNLPTLESLLNAE